MSTHHAKNWVNHLIIGCGAFIGLLIVIGLIKTVQKYFFNPSLPSSTALHISTATTTGAFSSNQSDSDATTPSVTTCENCLTQEFNNTQQTIPHGQSFTIELPQSIYPRTALVIIDNPAGAVKEIQGPAPQTSGNWAVTYRASTVGKAEIIVKSTFATASDYHVSIILQ